MDRDDALKLLKGGEEGIREWNQRAGQARQSLTSPMPTSAVPTSAVPTSAVPTSAMPTSAVPTSAVPTSAVPTSAVPTSAVPTSAKQSARDTIFGDVDLSEVKGLESITHKGPSTVGVDTLFRSGGKIPEVFLRGCGVPDALIAIPAFDPGFACSRSSSTRASSATARRTRSSPERLHSKMRDKGLRVWFAPEDVQGGKKLHEQIDEAIRVYDKLLLVLSPESMNSEWVKTEIRKARKAEIKEGRRKLFPIRLVDFKHDPRSGSASTRTAGRTWAVEIREFFIPDFSNWKDHDSFEAAFARLLKDLKAEESIGSKHD